MNKFIALFALSGVLCFGAFAQEEAAPVVDDVEHSEYHAPNGEIFVIVDETPQFPGGDSTLLQFIIENLNYPPIALDNGISGRVICSFVIDPNGKVTNAEVLRPVNPELDKEALRVISLMPDWKPGRNNGKPVSVRYTLPIIFRLPPEPEPEPRRNVFVTVEEMPQFPGGEQALKQYVKNNLKYPQTALNNGISGSVICTFVIDPNGKVTDAEVLRSVNPELDKEALRIINLMPDWKPGRNNGKPESVRYTLPIVFRLQN